MSASERICETCVYCTFAGNCDRYDKPLTSIEQPACNGYEIHPLLAENAKLKELLKGALDCIYCGNCEACHYELGGCTLRSAMCDLGIETKYD